MGQPTTVIVSPSIAQSGQPGAPATRSVLTESTIILGLTDCLVERTEVEVQAWLLPRVFNAVCVETDATPADTTASGQTVRTANRRLSLPLIFNETCQVLQSSARLGLQNSARTVRAAIMQDFNDLPTAVLAEAKKDSGVPGRVVELAELAYQLLSQTSRDPESWCGRSSS